MIWALKLPGDRWYPPDHFLLDDRIMRKSENAKPFFVKAVAEWFQTTHEGSEIVPHPHPELWAGFRGNTKI